MKGDFSRWTTPNAKVQGYAGLLMQQGRLYTDADWNECVQIQVQRSESALEDIIGKTGTPKNKNGFEITKSTDGFNISSGHYYIDGVLVNNPSNTTYQEQLERNNIQEQPLSEILDGESLVLIYLEVTKIDITAQEDSRLIDPALNGTDTATRIKIGWRTSILPLQLSGEEQKDLIQNSHCGRLPNIPGWRPGDGKMKVELDSIETLPDESDCLIPPESGYLSQENQLYRIQILQGGKLGESSFIWSRENASVQALLINDNGSFVLQGDRDEDSLGFVDGGWVEVFDDSNTLSGKTGQLTHININENRIVTFTPSISSFDQMLNPRIRRWDQAKNSPETGIPLSSSLTDIERGIKVSFTDGTYQEGDFWVFEARAATGNAIWPPYPVVNEDNFIPSMGWGKHYAPLALAEVKDSKISKIIDLRAKFPSLSCLKAEDIKFDDSICNMGSENIQEAIENLCQKASGNGLCSITVSSVNELINRVRSLSPKQSAKICLKGDQFSLENPIKFEGLGHITIEAAGPRTIVSVKNAEVAFLFKDCASVRIIDFSINGGRPGQQTRDVDKGRLGSISAIDCSDVSIERMRIHCKAGLDRQTSCISTRSEKKKGQVLIRDCKLYIGQAQIGIQVIGAKRSIIENNTLEPISAPTDIVRKRIFTDRLLIKRLTRGVLNFPKNTNEDIHLDNEPVIKLFYSERKVIGFNLKGIGRGIGKAVIAAVHPDVSNGLEKAFNENTNHQIKTEREMHTYLRNIISTAFKNKGKAIVGGKDQKIFDLDTLRLTKRSYISQGITIAGNEVDETQIMGNSIIDTIDGIHVAASSSNDKFINWRKKQPSNIVHQAIIERNKVIVSPLASQDLTCGIFIGHVNQLFVSKNIITGVSIFKTKEPHYGIYQHGYRGQHFTWNENSVSMLKFPFVILPKELHKNQLFTWSLRDNSPNKSENESSHYQVGNNIKIM